MKNSKSIRENINKNEWRKEFVRISKQFFENATIGGLRRLFGEHPLKMPYSMMWAVMWLCAVGYAFYLNILTIIIYCKFDVKTKITYETADEFNFPAITMCNENIFRRSVVGGSFLAMVMLASYVTTDTKRISRIAVEVKSINIMYYYLLANTVTLFQSTEMELRHINFVLFHKILVSPSGKLLYSKTYW